MQHSTPSSRVSRALKPRPPDPFLLGGPSHNETFWCHLFVFKSAAASSLEKGECVILPHYYCSVIPSMPFGTDPSRQFEQWIFFIVFLCLFFIVYAIHSVQFCVQEELKYMTVFFFFLIEREQNARTKCLLHYFKTSW